MRQLIYLLQKKYNLHLIKNLQYQLDQWLVSMEGETVPDDILAFCIGLYETQGSYAIYLIGSKTYSTESNDWAMDQDFIPKNKVIRYGQPTKIKWDKLLEDVVSFFSKNADKYPILQRIPHVSVGFDDGDLISIK